MSRTVKLGIAGLGTVGCGLVELLSANAERMALGSGARIVISGVSARDRGKDRGITLPAEVTWHDDPVALAVSPLTDVFVELIGGSEGVAKEAVEAALRAGKPVVTANKALLADHGVGLARLAEEAGVALAFEAAVAGGIPVIKTLRESLIGNSISRVYGILNGTCNYILTRMQEEGLGFAEILADAQALGYAEADPTFDVGGFDTAHKLSLLTSLAFGTQVAFDQVHVEGIESITPADIDAADDLGYRIKLLGVAMRTDSGIEQRVHPAMVAKGSAIAQVSGVTNGVAIDGDFVGDVLLVGPGAGSRATASAVAGDIADVVRGNRFAPFIKPAGELEPYQRAQLRRHQGAYYLRLSVYDKPGAMAAIATRMGEQNVSLESIVQRRHQAGLPGSSDGLPEQGSPANVILITHKTNEQAIRNALAAIEADGKIAATPQVIRIEQL